MADNKNEYRTVLKISAEGDAKGVDAFTESLKRLKGEAQGSNAELSKSSASAKEAAAGMAQAAASAGKMGGEQEKAAAKSAGWFSATRKGLESVSHGVGMLTKLTTLFGIPAALNSAITLVKHLNDALNATKKAAEEAATEMAKLDIATMARQTEALADAQERAADAVSRQVEGLNKIAAAKAAEQDAGFAADLAELDAEEQRALADSLANDPNNEAGRTALAANFASRRRKLQRDRELAAKKSALDQSEESLGSAKRTAADREGASRETAERLAEVERKIAEQLARGAAALNPATAPRRIVKMGYGSSLVDTDIGVDTEEQKRIADEVKDLLDGDNGLKKQREALTARLGAQKGAAADAALAVPAAESAARRARTEYQSAEKDASRRDAALDAMDALKVQEARRRQSAQFSKDQATEQWEKQKEADRKAADAALPPLYSAKGALEKEQIGLESRERQQRDALDRLRADEATARWQAGVVSSDPSLTPRERRDKSESLNKKADQIHGDALRAESALGTIEASFKSVADKMERVAARIRDAESRSTAGGADIFQP